MNSIRTIRQYSKTSKELFDKLAEQFSENKLYYADTEYEKYIPDVGYRRFDYIDYDNKICIEYHGEYWHNTDEAIINDNIKKSL